MTLICRRVWKMKGGSLLILSLACVLSCCAGAGHQWTSAVTPKGPPPSGNSPAPDKVQFPSYDADLTGGSPTIIDGYLFKPAGQGPFPAVVALHGCAGLFAESGRFQRRDLDWARRLQNLGYVVLFPDSLTPRGIKQVCTRKDIGGTIPFRERPRDAYGALTWLQSQPFVRKDHVGLLGWSNGGSTVLSTIDASSKARPPGFKDDFRVAIAFYPGCRTIEKRAGWTTHIPLTILIGEADEWTAASYCTSLAERACHAGAPVEIFTYPEAHHDFDAPDQPLTVRGGLAYTARRDGQATIGTNPAARADAIERVRALLARYLHDEGVRP
jgi:dienelactone hydrolase